MLVGRSQRFFAAGWVSFAATRFKREEERLERRPDPIEGRREELCTEGVGRLFAWGVGTAGVALGAAAGEASVGCRPGNLPLMAETIFCARSEEISPWEATHCANGDVAPFCSSQRKLFQEVWICSCVRILFCRTTLAKSVSKSLGMAATSKRDLKPETAILGASSSCTPFAWGRIQKFVFEEKIPHLHEVWGKMGLEQLPIIAALQKSVQNERYLPDSF